MLERQKIQGFICSFCCCVFVVFFFFWLVGLFCLFCFAIWLQNLNLYTESDFQMLLYKVNKSFCWGCLCHVGFNSGSGNIFHAVLHLVTNIRSSLPSVFLVPVSVSSPNPCLGPCRYISVSPVSLYSCVPVHLHFFSQPRGVYCVILCLWISQFLVPSL